MTSSLYKKILLVGAIAGVAFSGYLSGVKYFTSVCAFNEPCPYVLGYPACWYGLAMFLTILIISLLGYFNFTSTRVEASLVAAISGFGILFAGSLTAPEVGKLMSGAVTGYRLGLPTCAYGLIFYTFLFALSLYYLKRGRV